MAGESALTGGEAKAAVAATEETKTAVAGATEGAAEQTQAEKDAAAAQAVVDKAAADKLEADLKSDDPAVKAAAEKQKADADKAAADKVAADKAKDKPKGAPEKYDDFTMPEGVEVDKAKLEAFVPLAKEANLDQATAQKFVSFAADWQKELVANQYKAWGETKSKWLTEAKADAEIGKQGWEESLGIAKVAIDALDPLPEGKDTTPFRDMLDITGTGDHPEQIRMLKRIGKLVKEHPLVFGHANDAKGSETPSAKDLYPKSNMK